MAARRALGTLAVLGLVCLLPGRVAAQAGFPTEGGPQFKAGAPFRGGAAPPQFQGDSFRRPSVRPYNNITRNPQVSPYLSLTQRASPRRGLPQYQRFVEPRLAAQERASGGTGMGLATNPFGTAGQATDRALQGHYGALQERTPSTTGKSLGIRPTGSHSQFMTHSYFSTPPGR